MDSPRVTVVIPNWNGIEHLDLVLGSLATQSARDFETIVVDNGSTDGSLVHLREHWPEVRVLELGRNLGFAPAVNVGFDASSTPYVALINNDVELDHRWLEATVGALEARPRVASIASKQIDWRDRSRLDGAGDAVSWDGHCIRRGRGEPDRGQYDAGGPVIAACAAAALYRRSALDHVGLFDASFFAYLEDVDWGLRAQLLGWDCYYEPEAIAYHVGAASSSRVSGLEKYLGHRNMLTMMLKNFPAFALIAYSPFALARRIAALAKAAPRGEVRLVLRAWVAALRRLPDTLARRREIQRRRVRGYAHLRTMVKVRPGEPTVRVEGDGRGATR